MGQIQTHAAQLLQGTRGQCEGRADLVNSQVLASRRRLAATIGRPGLGQKEGQRDHGIPLARGPRSLCGREARHARVNSPWAAVAQNLSLLQMRFAYSEHKPSIAS